MPEIRPPHIKARSARCRAVLRWYRDSTTADVLVRLHDEPRWPVIEGGGQHAQVPRPVIAHSEPPSAA